LASMEAAMSRRISFLFAVESCDKRNEAARARKSLSRVEREGVTMAAI